MPVKFLFEVSMAMCRGEKMEENKNVEQQGNGGGRKRRRHRHGRGNGGNGGQQNQQTQQKMDMFLITGRHPQEYDMIQMKHIPQMQTWH